MQRTAIIALMLLCPVFAGAQQKDKKAGKSKIRFGVGASVNGTTTIIPVDHTKSAAPPRSSGDQMYQQAGAPMPPVRVVYPGKAVYTGDEMRNDANLFVMLFNPTCEHCEDMTMALEQDIALFQKSNILLMAAPGMGPYLEYFENNTKVKKFPKIKFGLDSANFISHTFNYVMLPQVNVYDADRKLLKTFNGITTIDSLKPYIQ